MNMYCYCSVLYAYLFYVLVLFKPLPSGDAGVGLYLIFRVMMVSAARMMEMIQKRTVIFDSWNGR